MVVGAFDSLRSSSSTLHTMQYLIAKTWNGEGYSYLNEASLMNFESDNDAQKHIESLLNNEQTNAVSIETGRVFYERGDDDGTFQWMRVDNPYGAVILCNINDVFPLQSAEEFNDALKTAMDQADPEDELEDDLFIGAYEGDFDYQFVKF